MVDGVEGKPVWVFLPSGTDELVGRQSFECLETLGEVVGHQEGLEVFLQMLMGFVIELLTVASFKVRFMRSTFRSSPRAARTRLCAHLFSPETRLHHRTHRSLVQADGLREAGTLPCPGLSASDPCVPAVDPARYATEEFATPNERRSPENYVTAFAHFAACCGVVCRAYFAFTESRRNRQQGRTPFSHPKHCRLPAKAPASPGRQLLCEADHWI